MDNSKVLLISNVRQAINIREYYFFMPLEKLEFQLYRQF